MSLAPRVSVLLPVYNCDLYLRSALDSICSQKFPDFEVIAVDDGSTDQSLDILQSIAASDSRFRVLSRPNTGIVGAMNDGLELCRGELIARMDADDIALPDRFGRQVAHMDAHPECLALGTRVDMIDSEGNRIRSWSTETRHEAIDNAHMLGNGGAITHPSSMIRRSAIDEVGGYREKCNLAEDLDLFLRLAERGQLANLPDVLLQWRMHLASTGTTKRVAQRAAAATAVREAHERRGIAFQNLTSLQVKPASEVHQIMRMWAWWALEAGNLSTARKYAWASFRQGPLDREQFRLLACTARGH